MDVKPGTPLRSDQRADPVLWRHSVALALGGRTFERMLRDVFGAGRSKRLQTWARDPESPDSPHWIGVRSGTPLHTDPRYPRYTHQLIVRNDGWALGGVQFALPAEPFVVGTLFCADTHSPHILLRDARIGNAGLYYLAASMDSRTPLTVEQTLPALLAFVEASPREW